MDRLIYGGDTETVHGQPNTMQFYSEDVAVSQIFFVDKSDALRTFLKWCGSLKQHHEHVIYIHFLSFDLPELLYGKHELLAIGEYDFTYGDWRIKGVYGTPTFCTIERKTRSHHTSITLVDSYSFYRGSLLSAGAIFCPSLPKLARPSDIGEVRITKRDTKKIEYAMRDAEVAYHIGKGVDKIHQEFDIKQSVSVADMSAKIFKRKFLTYTIPQPEMDVVHAAMQSYHGGKNGLNAEPGWHLGVTSIDISSAYSESMAGMPSFEHEKLYKNYRKAKGSVNEVPRYGVYCISGSVKDCIYPCLFGHDFKPLSGSFMDVWVQGYDLNEALRSGEVRLKKIRGHYYDAERDHGAPALRAYCDTFYERKQTEQDKALRYMYKTCLNSLYGKFIQTRKRNLTSYVDIDSGEETAQASELIAGGMFHPFIASAITAQPRARIHRLEHKWSALHTATDSVFTQKKVEARTGKANFDLYPGTKRLGCLEFECSGDLLLIRNKCYIIYIDEAEFQKMLKGVKTPEAKKKLEFDIPKSKAFAGKRLRKWAMHGFQGTMFDLERLAASGKRTYTYKHANRLKESVKRGLQVNDFIQRTGTLRVGPIRLVTKQKRRKR